MSIELGDWSVTMELEMGGQEVRRAGVSAGQWGLDVAPTWEPLKVLQQRSSLVKVVFPSLWGVRDGE